MQVSQDNDKAKTTRSGIFISSSSNFGPTSKTPHREVRLWETDIFSIHQRNPPLPRLSLRRILPPRLCSPQEQRTLDALLLVSRSSSSPQHTRSNPHSTRTPPHTQSNNTASPDKPSDIPCPSSASGPVPAGTASAAGPGEDRSTFAAEEVGRRRLVGRSCNNFVSTWIRLVGLARDRRGLGVLVGGRTH
jgi:hypothetical protein